MTVKLLDVLKGFPTLAVRAVELSKRTLDDPEDARAWLSARGLDYAGDIIDDPGAWRAEVRDAGEFVPGSDRSIVLEGGVVRVGILAGAVAKGGEELLEIALDKLAVLTELDLVEVTLTGRPALGELAHFQIIKSLDAGELSVRKSAAFLAKDEAQRIVYAHALLPDLPDWQGDIVPRADVAKAAHSLLINIAKGRARGGEGTGVEHKDFGRIGHIVESSVDETAAHGIPGAWFVGIQITNDAVWKSIESGELKGVSIGGQGKREPLGTLEGVLKAKHPTDGAKAEQSLAEITEAVSGAVRLATSNEWAWIEKTYADRVVYRADGKLWVAGYTLDADGKATLANVVEARREYASKGGPDWSTPPAPITKPAVPPTPTAPDLGAAIAKSLAPFVERLDALERVEKARTVPASRDSVAALEQRVTALQAIVDARPIAKSKAAPVDPPPAPAAKPEARPARSLLYGPNYDEHGRWIGANR